MNKTCWFPNGTAYLAAAMLCVAILTGIMRLWKADLSVPLTYAPDALFTSIWIKSIIDNGWIYHNPYLGMPFGLDLGDFPAADGFHFLVVKIFSLFTSNWALIYNLYFILSFPLTTLVALAVMRRFGCNFGSAIPASLLFPFLPYHFTRAMGGHFFLSAYFFVPIMVLIVVWVFLDRVPLFRKRPRTRQASYGWFHRKTILSILGCCLIASSGVYYAFFGAFLLFVAGFAASIRAKSARPCMISMVLAGLLGLGVLANIAPNLYWQYRNGPNPIAVVRQPEEAELYGLKVSQLLLPATDHRVGWLAESKNHYNGAAPLVNENDHSSLGLIGSCGFLYLVSRLLIKRMFRPRHGLLECLSILNVFSVLLATVGGLGMVFSFWTSFSLIRGYNRACVYIAFFAFLAICLILDSLYAKLWTSKKGLVLFYLCIASLVCLGIVDQTNSSWVLPYRNLNSFDRDYAAFIQELERRVPENAMIYQLPVASFPEGGYTAEMHPYRHLLGYLYSARLRWSFGGMKGRESDLWQDGLRDLAVPELLRRLCVSGFGGIYLDRGGFLDHGQAIEAEISQWVSSPPLVSADQRLVFFSLLEYENRLRKERGEVLWQEEREQALRPVLVSWPRGFSYEERQGGQRWRWCGRAGVLQLTNLSERPRTVQLTMSVRTGRGEHKRLRIRGDLVAQDVDVCWRGKVWTARLMVPPGKHFLEMTCNAKKLMGLRDRRELVFRIDDFSVQEAVGTHWHGGAGRFMAN